MRTTLAAAVVVLAGCSPQDLAEPHEPSTGLDEVTHAVSVRFERGVALLTVSRELRNDTGEYQGLDQSLSIPHGAIATGFRVHAGAQWQHEQLLDVSEATEKWESLTGPGDAAPSTLGALGWSPNQGLELQLFGVAPGTSASIEYDLELPATYEAGGWQFEYPTSEVTPSFHFGRAPEAVATEVRDGPIETGGELTGFKVGLSRPAIDRAEAHWAIYPLDTGRTLWRLELDAASVLEPLPVRPNVVFVVDGSHSEGPEGIAAELELLAPYLASVPDAQVEVVVYRRTAERLFGRFVPVGEVLSRLASEGSRLTPGNGSNLELGAKLAAEALRQAGGVGRIVLFTDEQLRHGFSNVQALAALADAPPQTVVHLIARSATSGEELTEAREDGAPLAEVATASGGIFARVTGHGSDPVQAAKAMLGLVRPVQIDDFTVHAEGFPDAEFSVPTELVEGSSLRQMAIAETAPAQLVLTGKIWGRDFRRVVPTDFGLADRMPGLAIGSDEVRTQLTEDELRTAANASHAVSPVTSFFSAPPDAAPSVIGADSILVGDLSGRSAWGCGGSFSSHCGIRLGTALTVEYLGALKALLLPGVERCGLTGAATLSIEATGDEVVEVQASAQTPALAACLTEAAWAIRLPPIFTVDRTWRLDF